MAGSTRRKATNTSTKKVASSPIPSSDNAVASTSASTSNSTALISTNSNNSTAIIQTNVKPNKITNKSVPAFLNKLYLMVDDPKSDELIRWSDDGDSFYVPFEQRFGKEMLPRYFKHSNFGSFVRQLNMYGFHKVPHIQQGVLHSEPDSELLEFANANFLKSQPDLLHLIRRQKARPDIPTSTTATTSNTEKSLDSLDLPTLITDLTAIRKHQSALSADLKELQKSNNGLWTEVIQSRDRHLKQEDTVNKILRFLASVFGGQAVNDVNGNVNTGVEENGNVEMASPASVIIEDETNVEEVNSGKGKGKETNRSNVNRKSQLYLTDVPRNNSTSGNSNKQLEDEEEIEEISRTQNDNLPTISSASQYHTLPSMARTNSFNNNNYNSTTTSKPDNSSNSRFTAVPSPSTSSLNTTTNNNTSNSISPFENLDYSNISPEMLSALIGSSSGGGGISGSNGGDFLNLPSLPSFMSNPDFTRSLLPSPSTSTSTMSNPLAALLPLSSSFTNSLTPFNDTTLDQNLQSSLLTNNEIIKKVSLEKEDLDLRTFKLEEAIERLMNTLPEDTRVQLLDNNNGNAASGVAGGYDFGANSTGGEGGNDGWSNDDFMARFVNNDSNTSTTNTSTTANNLPPFSPQDFTFFDTSNNLNSNSNSNNFNLPLLPTTTNESNRSVSPSDSILWKGQNSTSSERSSPDDLEGEEFNSSYQHDGFGDDGYGGLTGDNGSSLNTESKGKGKKRKSDILGEDQDLGAVVGGTKKAKS